MVVIRNKTPIETAFNIWINNYPESFHWRDKERFYIFVKTVCRYSRSAKSYDWLKKKIKKSGKYLDEDVIDKYCDKFVELQEFHKASPFPIYEFK